MKPMRLTPILRRTVTIFRGRPLLFAAASFGLYTLSLLELFQIRSPHLSRPLTIGFFLFQLFVTAPFSFAFTSALCVETEATGTASAKNAWRSIRHQPHLVATTLVINTIRYGLFVLVLLIVFSVFVFVRVAICAALHVSASSVFRTGSLEARAFLWFSVAVTVALIARKIFPFSLAIPLVLIKQPSRDISYHAIAESRHAARKFFWEITVILLATELPYLILSFIGKSLTFPKALVTPLYWAAEFVWLPVGALLSTLAFIALTLIARESVADLVPVSSSDLSLQPTLPNPVILS
jgi:hypothetical protein